MFTTPHTGRCCVCAQVEVRNAQRTHVCSISICALQNHGGGHLHINMFLKHTHTYTQTYSNARTYTWLRPGNVMCLRFVRTINNKLLNIVRVRTPNRSIYIWVFMCNDLWSHGAYMAYFRIFVHQFCEHLFGPNVFIGLFASVRSSRVVYIRKTV